MKPLRLIALLLGAALPAGCAYTLGDARPSMMRGIETLAVPVSQNTTLEPNVEGMLADTIIKQLQTEGTYRIATERNSDATLFTKLVGVDRRAARSIRGNVLATSEFELSTTVEYRVVANDTGKEIMTGLVTGNTSFFVTPDLQTDEQQALPLAFSDAAVKLASRLGEGF